MERKIIQQGMGGYTIYLPKKWAERKGLKSGDLINIKEKDTVLIIGSQVKDKKEIKIEITEENKKDLRVILTHIYRKGFDTITLTGIDPTLIKKIKTITKNLLLGFEITETKGNRCKLENISEPTEDKYEVLLRRIFLIIQETQNTVLENLESGKLPNLKEVKERMHQQDRFILFCRRVLIKEKYEKETMIQWELLTFLMHIQHSYYYLCKYIVDNKVKSDKETINLMKELEKYYNLYYDSYFKKDMQSIHKLMRLKDEYQFGKCFKLISQSNNKKAVVMSLIREIFRWIQLGGSPIISTILKEESY